jgi:tetratricopeptide (TPR) repeat protein
MDKIEDLIEQGLHHYGLGDLTQAARLWVEALNGAPDDTRAREYLAYLGAHRPDVLAGIQIPPPSSDLAESPAPSAPPAASPAAEAPAGDDPFLLLGEAEPEERSPTLDGAQELFDLGDYEGALELVEKTLLNEAESPRALELKTRCQETLIHLFESKLGSLQRIPRLRIAPSEVVWLNLDHRAGFVLSQIDGEVNYEDLFSVSGMSRVDTARILSQLLRDGVIVSS